MLRKQRVQQVSRRYCEASAFDKEKAAMIGEAMMVGAHKLRAGWQGVVVVGELVSPPKQPDFTVLHSTRFFGSRKQAVAEAMTEMFVLYQQRYGWKHPEDPSRSSFDMPPAADVVTMAA